MVPNDPKGKVKFSNKYDTGHGHLKVGIPGHKILRKVTLQEMAFNSMKTSKTDMNHNDSSMRLNIQGKRCTRRSLATVNASMDSADFTDSSCNVSFSEECDNISNIVAKTFYRRQNYFPPLERKRVKRTLTNSELDENKIPMNTEPVKATAKRTKFARKSSAVKGKKNTSKQKLTSTATKLYEFQPKTYKKVAEISKSVAPQQESLSEQKDEVIDEKCKTNKFFKSRSPEHTQKQISSAYKNASPFDIKAAASVYRKRYSSSRPSLLSSVDSKNSSKVDDSCLSVKSGSVCEQSAENSAVTPNTTIPTAIKLTRSSKAMKKWVVDSFKADAAEQSDLTKTDSENASISKNKRLCLELIENNVSGVEAIERITDKPCAVIDVEDEGIGEPTNDKPCAVIDVEDEGIGGDILALEEEKASADVNTNDILAGHPDRPPSRSKSCIEDIFRDIEEKFNLIESPIKNNDQLEDDEILSGHVIPLEVDQDTGGKKQFYSIFYPNDESHSSLAQKKHHDKSSKKSKNRNSSKVSMAEEDRQLIIDAGQKVIGAVQCPSCGMVYHLGSENDESLHAKFHEKFLTNLKFPGWKKEHIVGTYHDGKVVMITKDDQNFMIKKVEDVLQIVDRDLGFPNLGFPKRPNAMFFLFISDKKVVGCLIVESIVSARRVELDRTSKVVSCYPEDNNVKADRWCSSTKAVKAICGINRIWVSREYRRKRIATRMLDCLRCNFLYGYVVSTKEMAFSDPSVNGREFAAAYTKTNQFLVYK